MAKSEEAPCVEVTPHNRSKCQSKVCHETLKKGEIRIGNSTKKNWWHINCVPEKQKSRVEGADGLEGFADLGAADQKKLQKEWGNPSSSAADHSEESDSEKKVKGKRKRNPKAEKEGKRKRKKKANDGTEKVKRARSAYIYFCNDKRAELVKNNPELKAKEILTELGALWSKLTEEDKKPYLEMQKEDKQRYSEEMKTAQENAKNNNNDNNNNNEETNGDEEAEAAEAEEAEDEEEEEEEDE